MRKMLVKKEHPAVQPVARLMEGQSHLTLVLWALDSAPHMLDFFETRHPAEQRPRLALDAGWAWARGAIKMPVAKRAILAAHNAATKVGESDPAGEAAARAIAHAVATVHVQTHAIGLVLYGVTAVAYASSEYPQDKDAIIASECGWYLNRLRYWIARATDESGPWAAFLVTKNASSG
jgi:hypothetical protein